MKGLKQPKCQQDVIDNLELALSIMGFGSEYNILGMYKKRQLPEQVLDGMLDMFGDVELKAQNLGISLDWYDIRVECIRLCGFPILTTKFMDAMTDTIRYLTSKSEPMVLDPMAGLGSIAKCLSDRGIKTRASDNFTDQQLLHGYKNLWCNVEKLDAIQALDCYVQDTDLILLSWPSYQSPIAADILKWLYIHKPEMPVIYIGELQGGCTADDEFFDLFKEIKVPDEHDCNRFYQKWESVNDMIFYILPEVAQKTTD